MLTIALKRVPPTTKGIYGSTHSILPKRMLLLEPRAALAFARADKGLGGNLVCSDMFRSGESSLEAVASGRGAQPPGYSAHNFGLAIDVAVSQTLNKTSLRYDDLLSYLAGHGWHCYRRDGLQGPESWHFNYLGDMAPKILPTLTIGRWARAAEELIWAHYGPSLGLDRKGVQTCLQRLRLYNGDIDGDLGPISRRAMEAFGRAWQTNTDPENERFQRTLAFVAAYYAIED
jgi:hypothetical protein